MKKPVLSLLVIGITILIVIGYVGLRLSKKSSTSISQDSSKSQNQTEIDNQSVSDGNGPNNQTYSLEEVSKHKDEENCWLILENKVYDVTEFASSHPGGKAILEGCGQDATELFETRPMGSGTPHSQRARNLSDQYFIGNLKK
jgi:cytochrome b involved in lipid metabolism